MRSCSSFRCSNTSSQSLPDALHTSSSVVSPALIASLLALTSLTGSIQDQPGASHATFYKVLG